MLGQGQGPELEPEPELALQLELQLEPELQLSLTPLMHATTLMPLSPLSAVQVLRHCCRPKREAAF